MVRSLWKAAVVVGLAWTGLAWAQSSSPAQQGGATPPERYMTVREEGGTPQRCKLLKTWREPNGAAAYEVQSVTTGERMTIVEAGQPAANMRGARSLATRIFRWGRGSEPPADAPAAPPGAQVFGTPVPSNSPAAPPQPWGGTPAGSSRFTSVPAPVPAPLTPRNISPSIMPPPMTGQKTAQTSVSPPVLEQKAVSTSALTRKSDVTATPTASAPIMPQPFTTTSPSVSVKPDIAVISQQSTTPTKSTASSYAPSSMPVIIQGANNSPGTPAQPRLTPTANGTCGCQTPSNSCCQPSCVCCPPAQPKQSLVGRIFKPNPPTTAVATTTAPGTPAPLPASLAKKTAIESAQPRDWRESWGKVEPWKNSAQAKANTPATNPATQPDPIKDPDLYRGVAMKQSLPTKTTAVTTSTKSSPPPEKPAVVKSIPPATPATATEVTAAPSPLNPRGGAVEMRPDESNAFWTPPPPPQPATPKYNAFGPRDGVPPPGMAGAPMGPMMSGAPMGPMPMAFQPPRPPSPPPIMDSGVPSGLANAFTVPGTRRPIPADFGPPEHVPNAFRDDHEELEAQGMASAPRPNMPPGQGMPGYPASPMPGTPMPGMPLMVPHGPVAGINPLMSVPPSPMPAPAMAAAPTTVPQTLATLKDALGPSQREMAAEQLGELNWRMQPQVVESLTKAAREDPAATVRAACVRALARMQANTAEVVAAVRDLKNDRDARVRQEAEEALGTLGVAAAPGQDSSVRQASHR
jgi:hypothetical protein